MWTLLVGLPSIAWPLGRDQSIFATTAWRMMNGALPYRDAFTFKPPGTLAVYALAEGLFGPSMMGIRVVDLGILALTAVAVNRLAAVHTRRPTIAWVSGVLYAPMVLGLGWWHTAQTDGWTASLAVFALLAITTGRPFLSGAMIGLLMVTKVTGSMMALPVLVLAWRAGRASMFRVLLGGGGVLALVAAAIGWSGVWPAFVESQRMAAEHARFARPPFALVQVVAWVVAGLPGAWVARLGLLGVPFLPREHERSPLAVRLGVLFALGGALSIAVQGRYWGYHLSVVVPAAAWSAGVAADHLTTLAPRLRLAGGPIAVLCALIAVPPNSWSFLVASTVDRPAALRTWTADDPRGFAPFVELADELSKQEGPLLFLGFDPVPVYLAQRDSISRYTFIYPLIVPWGREPHRARLLEELDAEPPRQVVVATGDAVANMTGDPRDSAEQVDAWPALSTWLTTHCTRAPDHAGYRLYDCKPLLAP